MTRFFKKSLLSICFTSCLLLSGCNDSDDKKSSPLQSSYLTEIPFTKNNEPIDILDNSQAITVMTYMMPNVLKKNVEATAVVMYPKKAPPKNGWKVVVWQHGTLGVGDSCAQSKMPFNNRVKPMAEELLALGYVVIAIDYEGLGVPGIHPYLHLESEANSAIYAIKAFKEKYKSKVNGEWMSVGQSQGGQASLGTAEFASKDNNYKGAVAGAPASNLGFIISEVAPKALTAIEIKEDLISLPLEQRTSIQSYATLLGYAALAGIGIKSYEPNFDFLEMFELNSRKSAQLAEGTNGENGLCLADIITSFKEDIINFMQEDKSKKVMDFPGVDLMELNNNQIILKFMNEISQPGTKPINKPVLVIQGQADTSVPHDVTLMMVNKLKKISPDNQDITMLSVPNASHTEAIDWKRSDLINFIIKHMPNE